MKETHCRCGKEKIPESMDKKVLFKYEGICFALSKFIDECPECAKEKAIRQFQTFGKKFISKKEKLEIDWNFYISTETENRDKNSTLNGVLKNIGILSYNPRGNWNITDGISNINPSDLGGSLYFTREKDARQYALLNYKGTSYNWWIQHIDKIISRKELVN